MQMPIGVHALVRRTHEDRVLRALQENGAMSRGEIARVVGLSRTTLSEITSSSCSEALSSSWTPTRPGSGRPAERLALDPSSAQFMGVDFGHRRVRVVVADAAHKVMASDSVRYEDSTPWTARTRAALGLVESLGADAGLHYGALQGIGIGVPGPYPASEGRTWSTYGCRMVSAVGSWLVVSSSPGAQDWLASWDM
ncbi:winged helix-turn-helix transcriptional regulator [Streptomyces sp. RS2]|uniref:winged helix-turn-helix transcriptional regulator n=1 Tax=Streptomyces sp. RS2 TaxID=1451205 RepID=UPI0021F91496|nr:winged helix-turn-helix transcriptional regulator [Streptomyces sp. RS2]MCW1100077.1 winged helix-turn-helix transcriptional regulator [Streptomyces sp. RS2]